MTTLVLCAGRQQRFAGTTPKQLMPFNGTPLLQRTINQINYYYKTPIIVTHNQQIQKFCTGKECKLFHPEDNSKCVNTLLSTNSLWHNRIFVLLGDVYYNKKCLDMTFNCNKDLCVIGNQVEIFSLSFMPSMRITNALEKAATHHQGKLWHLYRAYCWMPLGEHRRDTQNILSIPSDDTSDIDSYADYLKLKQEVEN